MKEKMSVKTIVAIGIGSAVFVILGRFVVIPTGIPNTNLETSYPFLALMSVVFGPVAGGLIYSEPASKVFTQGVFATVSNIVAVGIIGTLLMKAYASTRTKKGSLSKD